MKDMYKILKEKEPFSLALHSDADGVYSASLISSVFKIRRIECPMLFGDYAEDVALDLGMPLNKEWNGICIDHHYHEQDNPKYTLFFDYVPTGRIIYDNLKDYIPKEHLWKVAGSVTGDGQPELIPNEIWDNYKFLTEERGRVYTTKWSTQFSSYFVYSLLPSAINALCRLGNPVRAYEIVCNATEPEDILDNKDVMDAQDNVQKEVDLIQKSRPTVQILNNKFAFIVLETSKPEIRVEGLFASKIASGMKKYTIGVINAKNGKVSIRGVFALYLAHKLKERKWSFGGHPGYVGGNINPDDIDKLLRDIKEVLK